MPSAISATRRVICGLWRYMNASIKSRPDASATSNARRTSAADRLNGFSHSTCLPASRARIDHSMCGALGSEM